MATFFDSASLVMIPSGVKDGKAYSIKPTNGDGDFTFSRGTDTATRVNASGLIEKERSNQILQSNTFDNASWTKSNASVTANTAVAPDGTTTADTFTITANFGTISQAPTYASGQVSTYSVYVKNIDAAVFNLQVRTASTAGLATFNFSGSTLTSSTLTTGIAQGFTDEGNGWYRCFVTFVTSETNQLCRLQIQDSGDSVYVWGVQLEQGLVAQPYIETTTAAVYEGITDNLPRLDYSGGASCPSLLLEPSRTNLAPSSELYGNIFTNTSVTRNNTTSPTGYDEASLLEDDNTLGEHLLGENFGSITNGSTYTISCFFKSNGSGGRAVIRYFVGAWVYAVYNLDNGTISLVDGAGTADIQNYGNGWYRCILSATAVTDYTPFVTQIGIANSSNQFSYQGTSSLGVYYWGYQAEAGSYPTSYIPTYGTSASRAADVCGGAGNASTFNDSEGVLYAEISVFDVVTNSKAISIYKTSSPTSNAVILYYNGNRIAFDILNPSGTVSVTTNISNAKELNKVAIKYKSGDIALWFNGVELVTRTNTLSLSGLDILEFDFTSNNDFYGNTKQLLYFPTALTDSELAALTTL